MKGKCSNWVSGVTQPSCLNGRAFYIYVTGNVFGLAYKLLYFIWSFWGCLHPTRKYKAGLEWSKVSTDCSFSWLSFALTCYATGGNSPFINESEGKHLMLEDYVSKLAWALSKNNCYQQHRCPILGRSKHACSIVTTTESTTPVEQHHAFHKAEELKSAFLNTVLKVAYACIVVHSHLPTMYSIQH